MPKTTNSANTRPGAPTGYDELREFFPKASQRAHALAVKRDTIQVWDTHCASRLRATSQGRVTLLLAVCSTVSAHMLTSHDVGRWMLSPQPALHGRSPVDLLHAVGDEATGQIRRLVERNGEWTWPAEPVSNTDWEAMEAELDPAVVARIRTAYEGVVRGAVPEELDVYELI